MDWNLRDFHRYYTRRGTTYNAYLIKNEKTVLVDPVKYTLTEELEKHITEIVEPEILDYIIVNHVEMDRSSSLPAMDRLAKNAIIISSERGKDAIMEHYGSNFNIKTVKTGDELKLGS